MLVKSVRQLLTGRLELLPQGEAVQHDGILRASNAFEICKGN